VIRIIGIGSPFGDDACGLAAARRLAEEPPAGAEVVVADRPGAALIDLLDSVDATILIDAVRSGSPAGTLHDLDLRTLLRSAARPVSSHDLGVAATIQLADALGRLPARGRLLGIEAGSRPGTPSAVANATVLDAIPEVVRRARAWVVRFRAPSL
jgi:hydrogenase maturation protease